MVCDSLRILYLHFILCRPTYKQWIVERFISFLATYDIRLSAVMIVFGTVSNFIHIYTMTEVA